MAKRPKIFRPVAATANDLSTGAVVFRGRDGTWSPDIAAAEIAATPEAADTLLAAAQADQDADRVIEPALIEIVQAGAFVRPAALREMIRTTGPTIALPAEPPPARR